MYFIEHFNEREAFSFIAMNRPIEYEENSTILKALFVLQITNQQQ
jgi:hypothetical protein